MRTDRYTAVPAVLLGNLYSPHGGGLVFATPYALRQFFPVLLQPREASSMVIPSTPQAPFHACSGLSPPSDSVCRAHTKRDREIAPTASPRPFFVYPSFPSVGRPAVMSFAPSARHHFLAGQKKLPSVCRLLSIRRARVNRKGSDGSHRPTPTRTVGGQEREHRYLRHRVQRPYIHKHTISGRICQVIFSTK